MLLLPGVVDNAYCMPFSGAVDTFIYLVLFVQVSSTCSLSMGFYFNFRGTNILVFTLWCMQHWERSPSLFWVFTLLTNAKCRPQNIILFSYSSWVDNFRWNLQFTRVFDVLIDKTRTRKDRTWNIDLFFFY